MKCNYKGGCTYPAIVRGLCKTHYDRMRYLGEITTEGRKPYGKKPSAKCGKCGEMKPIRSLGLCNACYLRRLRQ